MDNCINIGKCEAGTKVNVKVNNREKYDFYMKGLLLLGIRGMAADAYRAAALGHHEQEVDRFFYKALIVIGMDDWTAEQLLPVVLEMGKKCMAMLE